ncbi:MAG: type II secretion system protein [Planctomycetes bacterium]|nr:type II secretion system protein [Planctomycetota bacterium]
MRMPAAHHAVARRGFSLIELLVTISIVAILAALVMAGVSTMRSSARKTQTTSLVQMLHVAMREYAQSDRRHMFPDERSDRMVAYATSGAPQALNLLEERAGYLPQWNLMEPADASGLRFMRDAWGHRMRYQLDDWQVGRIDPDPVPVKTTPPVDLGPPVKPAALADWNPRGDRPYAYVYSRGNDDSDDGRGWIYVAETP